MWPDNRWHNAVMAAALQLDRHEECAALTDVVRSAFAANGGPHTRKTLKKRTRFWLPDGPFTRMYWLERGQLTLVRTGRSGRETALRTVAAGEWFGEYCFCGASRLPHDAVAARADQDCLFQEVDSGRFLRELTADAAALRGFLGSVCKHLAQADRRVEILTRRGAEARVCAMLLELVDANPPPGGAGSRWRSVSVTHAELAAMTAMNRPNVSLTLGALRRRSLIRYARNQPILVDRTKVLAHLEAMEDEQN
jgi:CRP-like cAMP-binding protein